MEFNMKNAISILIASSFFMLCLTAKAETTKSTLKITAVALGSCSISSNSERPFGNYDTDGETDLIGNTGTSLQVTCNGDTS